MKKIIAAVLAVMLAFSATEAYAFAEESNALTVLSEKMLAAKTAKLIKVPSISCSSYPTSLELRWKAVSGATSYIVKYSTDGKKWTTKNVSEATITLTGLSSDTEYRIKIAAANATGTGTYSDIFNAKTNRAVYKNFEYIVNSDNKTVTVTGYMGKAKSVTIPSKIDGKTVTALGDDTLFDGCDDVTSITIPSTVTKINPIFAADFPNLKKIKVSSGNKKFRSINGILYENNSDGTLTLTRCPLGISGVVTLPKNVSKIGDRAFNVCKKITSVKLPASVKVIEGGAFAFCEKLKTVNIPNGVTEIPGGAFGGCWELGKIKIPDSVTVIGPEAFSGCEKLQTTLPDSVIDIGWSAFSGCKKLDTPLPANLSLVGQWAFCGTGLKKVTVPYILYEMSSRGIFADCENLTSVTFSGSGENPNNIQTPPLVIGEKLFRDCKNLKTVKFERTDIGEIAEDAFIGCDKVKFSYMGKTYSDLEKLLDDTSTFIFKVKNGVLERAERKSGSKADTLIIPDGVTEIGRMSCLNVGGSEDAYGLGPDDVQPSYIAPLRKIVLPNGVTKIGVTAFSGNKNLTSINIPDSVTYICTEAFKDCVSLTSIKLPDSVTTLEKRAFVGCEKINVTYKGKTYDYEHLDELYEILGSY